MSIGVHRSVLIASSGVDAGPAFQMIINPRNTLNPNSLTLDVAFDVDWGSGTPTSYVADATASQVPTGTITVTCPGTQPGRFKDINRESARITITGGQSLTSMANSCKDGTHLLSFVIDDTSNVTDFSETFRNCTKLICLSHLNTTNQTTTANLFTNTGALTAPNASEQTALLSGSNYTNSGACP